MQWLTLVSEDAGTQNLKSGNRRPVIAHSNVDAVAHSARIGENPVQQQPRPPQDRRRHERRHGDDRRQHQTAVLLDTRSRHDRRNRIENRRQAPAEDTPTTTSRTRINLYV